MFHQICAQQRHHVRIGKPLAFDSCGEQRCKAHSWQSGRLDRIQIPAAALDMHKLFAIIGLHLDRGVTAAVKDKSRVAADDAG